LPENNAESVECGKETAEALEQLAKQNPLFNKLFPYPKPPQKKTE